MKQKRSKYFYFSLIIFVFSLISKNSFASLEPKKLVTNKEEYITLDEDINLEFIIQSIINQALQKKI